MGSSESELSSESLDLIYNHVSPSDFKKVRRKHAMAGLYLSGFLDAKVPSKNRPFGPWKTWKTQWCMIRRCGAHLEIQIGSAREQITHQIQVPQDTVICRTESRSKPHAFGVFQYSDCKRSNRRASVYLAGHSETETQKWIGIMRDILRPPIHQVGENEFSVSLIDTEFSRSAGFSGLYGNLSYKGHHLIIRDPHSNQIKVSWHWNHMQKIQIFQSECTEDFQRTVSIRTNCEFPKGIGELRLFCLQGYELYEALIKRLRSLSSTRLLSSPLPPIPTSPPATPPSSLLMSRRMSRSENDLQRSFLQSSLLRQRSHGNSPARTGTCPDSLSSAGSINKSISSLHLPSPGVFMSTPGCSEPESLNEYDSIDKRLLRDKLNSLIIEEKEDLSSDISSSSSEEIYEEIHHHLLPPDDEVPPPLPPRPPKHQQFLSPSNAMFTIGDLGEMRKRSVSQPVSPVTMKKSTKPLDRSDTISLSRYLPMNPSLGAKAKMTPLQQSYVYMANLTNSHKIIVSEPVPL